MPIITPSSGGGLGSLLFDSTLGANAASIDTGANGIGQSANVLEVWLYVRTTQAVLFSTVQVTCNNDGGAHYDLERTQGINVTASAAPQLAGTSWVLDAPGASVTAGYFGTTRLTIPGYTQTNGFKCGELTHGMLHNVAGNAESTVQAIAFQSTVAISRMAVAAGSGNLLAGSRMVILGR